MGANRSNQDGWDAFKRGRSQERQRLARELHDGVLQSLAHVALSLEAARAWLRQHNEEPPKELELTAHELRASIKEMREVLTSDDDPTSWQPGTLVARIEAELAELSKGAGIRFDLELSPTALDLYDVRLEREVFLATREALRNLVRHSGATEAKLAITFTPENLTITLVDDGTGFRHTTGAKSAENANHDRPHYGLKSIVSRINDLGGRVSISSSKDRGTRIFLSVPITQAVGEHSWKAGRATHRTLHLALGGVGLAGAIAAGVFIFQAPSKHVPIASPPTEKMRIASASPALEANSLAAGAIPDNEASGRAATSSPAAESPLERLDLSTWDYELISRKTHQDHGLKSRILLFRHNETKELLIAQEFPGSRVFDASTTKEELLEHEYVTVHEDGAFSVAWNNNDALYVLTAPLPEKDLIAIARSITWNLELAGRFLD